MMKQSGSRVFAASTTPSSMGGSASRRHMSGKSGHGFPPRNPVAKAKKLESVAGDPSLVFDAFQDPLISEIAESVTRECGPGYRTRFADDLIRVGTGGPLRVLRTKSRSRIRAGPC